MRDSLREFLLASVGFAALGTVADVVPLVDENRVLVRHGLEALRHRPWPGVAALATVAHMDKKPRWSSEDIAFSLAPRLNAAGRLGQADLAVELLLTDSTDRAEELARFLNELNQQRDHVERSIFLNARKQLAERFDPQPRPGHRLVG